MIIFPSAIIPPPTPVEMVIYIRFFIFLFSPKLVSASAAKVASCPIITGKRGKFFLRIGIRDLLCQVGKFGGKLYFPSKGLIGPAEEIPIPVI